MLRWIERTRKKPKAVRDQYALLVAVLCTGVIALAWSFSLPTRFQALVMEADTAAESSEESRSAFGQFFKNTKEQAAAALDAARSGSTAGENASSSESTDTTANKEPRAPWNVQASTTTETSFSSAVVPRTVLIATTSRATQTPEDRE